MATHDDTERLEELCWQCAEILSSKASEMNNNGGDGGGGGGGGGDGDGHKGDDGDASDDWSDAGGNNEAEPTRDGIACLLHLVHVVSLLHLVHVASRVCSISSTWRVMADITTTTTATTTTAR